MTVISFSETPVRVSGQGKAGKTEPQCPRGDMQILQSETRAFQEEVRQQTHSCHKTPKSPPLLHSLSLYLSLSASLSLIETLLHILTT